jgi:hypothetical protein
MRKIVFYSILSLILLTGCSSTVETEIADKIKSKLNEEESITKYITDEITINQSEPERYQGFDFIDFDVQASTNSDFANLSNGEKSNVLSAVTDIIESNTDRGYQFHCGEGIVCAFSNIEFSNGEDIYSYESINGVDSDLVLKHNGENIHTPVSTTNKTIHAFMEQKYNEITNYGESYDPEIHDPMVAKLASEQFNISEEEAGQIIIEISMQQ